MLITGDERTNKHQEWARVASEALMYVKRIRNESKKAYGLAYLKALAGHFEEPERGELSVMGAQAVRMELYRILGKNPEFYLANDGKQILENAQRYLLKQYQASTPNEDGQKALIDARVIIAQAYDEVCWS